jgi:hypothetical protein
MMDQLDSLVEWFVEMSGLSPFWIKGIGIGILLFILLTFLRKPMKIVRLILILAILGSLAYVGYNMVQVGTAQKERLIDNPMDEIKKGL